MNSNNTSVAAPNILPDGAFPIPSSPNSWALGRAAGRQADQTRRLAGWPVLRRNISSKITKLVFRVPLVGKRQGQKMDYERYIRCGLHTLVAQRSSPQHLLTTLNTPTHFTLATSVPNLPGHVVQAIYKYISIAIAMYHVSASRHAYLGYVGSWIRP